jgi:hypothetical protein
VLSQAVAVWKGYISQMAVLLVEADAGGSANTMATLQRLAQELVRRRRHCLPVPSALWRRMLVLSPILYHFSHV